MSNQRIRLHAFLKLLSPLHIAAPGASRLDTSTMEVVYTNAGVPLTSVQKLAVYTPSGVAQVPVIAANNLVGRLRRHAANHILDVIQAKGQKISIQTYSALTCGAVTGKPDGRDVTFDEYRETRAHPFIGLFGGGPRMMRRYVRAFNAVPVSEATRFMFERVQHPNFDELVQGVRNDDRRRILGRWIFNRNDDLRELINIGKASATIEDFESQIVARQAAILADRSGDDDRASSRHSTRAFSAFEFVVPGVVFPLTFEFDVSSAQLGLFLLTLDSFARDERLGGHARNGLGQFSLDDVVITDMDGEPVASGLFTGSRLDRENSWVAGHLRAWAEAASDLDAATLDRLYAPPVDEKPKKAAKA